MHNASRAWYDRLTDILKNGETITPRQMLTKEVLGAQSCVNMQYPMVINPRRNLNYRFSMAEAYWVCTGDNRVEELQRYGPNMRRYSDDGVILQGAYGPPIREQLAYVVRKLLSDPDTRQAGLTIWRPNPSFTTKDLPCTVSMFFHLRRSPLGELLLHNHTNMRSSDAYLGFPYDVVTFSLVATLVCTLLNETTVFENVVQPGTLFLTMASSHLYEQHWETARACLQEPIHAQPAVPGRLYTQGEESFLATLRELRDTWNGDPRRWWVSKETADVYGA